MDALSNLLKTFTIDYWYKMLLIASLAFMVISLTMKIYAIPNNVLFLLAFGGFLIGMGEWINRPYQERINLDYSYKISGRPRRPKVGGIALDLVGAALVVIGAVKTVLAAI